MVTALLKLCGVAKKNVKTRLKSLQVLVLVVFRSNKKRFQINAFAVASLLHKWFIGVRHINSECVIRNFNKFINTTQLIDSLSQLTEFNIILKF